MLPEICAVRREVESGALGSKLSSRLDYVVDRVQVRNLDPRGPIHSSQQLRPKLFPLTPSYSAIPRFIYEVQAVYHSVWSPQM